MNENKRLRLSDLNDEQVGCLRDHNRRAEAHRMLDDLRDRVGYDVERVRATLPRLGAFREIVESYALMTEVGTGGNCTAVRIPCDDGTYLLITDLSDPVVPADDAEVVLVGRYTDGDNEPVDITRDLPASEFGPREVRTCDLEGAIDTALGLTTDRRAAGVRRGTASARALNQTDVDVEGMAIAEGPYRIEPDQASQGCQLAIVSAAGEVLARTPKCPEFGAPEQAQDWCNAAQLASVWTLRHALEEIEAFDQLREYSKTARPADDYSEVARLARSALHQARDMRKTAAEHARAAEATVRAREPKIADEPRPRRSRPLDFER